MEGSVVLQYSLAAINTDNERVQAQIHIRLSLKVTGESSIEVFVTNNEVVYISSRVHVSNKLTRTKYSY